MNKAMDKAMLETIEKYTNFTDRESYRVARQQWRNEYAEVSQKIREARADRLVAEREFAKVQIENPGKNYTKEFFDGWINLAKIVKRKNKHAKEANNLLAALGAMKEKSKNQWILSRLAMTQQM